MDSRSRDRAPLRRWPNTDEGFPRYRHPNGYVIYREKRNWIAGRINIGGPPPMYWWTVKPLFGDRRYRTERPFDTLRDAREWCDEHPKPAPLPHTGDTAKENPEA